MAENESRLGLYGNTLTRTAVQRNLVTFPAQIPAFAKPPGGHIQQRVVQLYFIRNWSVREICDRYCLGKTLVQNLISEWRIRAVSAGLIQEISAEDLTELERELGPEAKTAAPFPNRLSPGRPWAHIIPPPDASRRLLTAIASDCVALGLALSASQMREIEAVIGPEPAAPVAAGDGIVRATGGPGWAGQDQFETRLRRV